MYQRARQVYLVDDPKASVRWRTLTLSTGHAIEIIASYVRRTKTKSFPLSTQSYLFLRGGKAYEFVYLTSTPKAGTYFPVFAESARSIRFVSR